MGKLITIVGNTGVGKTTLARLICEQENEASYGVFVPYLEQHIERPFQALFARELSRYALANQSDYLLFRAEQEQEIRSAPIVGIQDGGLDMDFFVFTRHFYQKGYLSTADFHLCSRLHSLLRHFLPPPDLIIWLDAPLSVIAERYLWRNRPLEIAALEDLKDLDELLKAWLSQNTASPMLKIDAHYNDPRFSNQLESIRRAIQEQLG